MLGGASALFSARWSTRISVVGTVSMVFTSDASGGSRVRFDDAVVLDAWEEHGSEQSSELVSAGPGFHHVVYEYRSAETSTDETPTDSYAKFAWTGFEQTILEPESSAPVYADVGWFATSVSAIGTGFDSGLVRGSDISFEVIYTKSFATSPLLIFAGLQSISEFEGGGHIRLVESGDATSTLAVEFCDSCDAFAAQNIARTIAWLAMPSGAADARIHQQSTFPSDVVALLEIKRALSLPAYLRWANGTDPCNTRWSGIECRAGGGQAPRVTVLDIKSIDLTGLDIPWYTLPILYIILYIVLYTGMRRG